MLFAVRCYGPTASYLYGGYNMSTKKKPAFFENIDKYIPKNGTPFLNENIDDDILSSAINDDSIKNSIIYSDISIDELLISDNIRTNIDDASIDELSNSISKYGLLNPITVVSNNNKYLLIAGHRRLLALKKLNYTSVPCMIVSNDVLDKIIEVQLIENIQREDISDNDLNSALITLYKKYNDISVIADMLHKSKSWVSKHLKVAIHEISDVSNNTIEDDNTDITDTKDVDTINENVSTNVNKKKSFSNKYNSIKSSSKKNVTNNTEQDKHFSVSLDEEDDDDNKHIYTYYNDDVNIDYDYSNDILTINIHNYISLVDITNIESFINYIKSYKGV